MTMDKLYTKYPFLKTICLLESKPLKDLSLLVFLCLFYTSTSLFSQECAGFSASVQIISQGCYSTETGLRANPSGGDGPYRYYWEDSYGNSGNTRDITVTYGGAYYVTITDDENCRATASIDLPAPEILGPDTICRGDVAILQVQDPNVVSYEWAGSGINGATTPAVSVSPSSSRYYAVTVTYPNGCRVARLKYVYVNQGPNVNLPSLRRVCEGTDVSLSAIPYSGFGPYTYQWSDGLGTDPQINVVPPSPLVRDTVVTYRVTVTDRMGCTREESTNVEVFARPALSFNSTDQSCDGNLGSVLMNVTNVPGRYYMAYRVNGGSWIGTNDNVGGINLNNLTEGYYDIESKWLYNPYSSFGYCAITYDSIYVGSDTLDKSDLPVDSLCSGDFAVLSPNFNVSWFSTDTSVATISTSGAITAKAPGAVSFYYETASCVSPETDSLDVVPQLEVELDYNGSLCVTDSSMLSPIITGGSGTYSYQWSGPSGFTSTDENVTVIENGNYYLTVTDVLGCEDYIVGYLHQKFEPLIAYVSTTLCEGDSVTLNAQNSDAISYQWSANAGGGTDATAVVHPTPPNSSYQVTVTNSLGCTAVADVQIDVDAAPVIDINGPNTLCISDSTNVISNVPGTWTTNNSSIINLRADGTVIGLSPGIAVIGFVSDSTGCDAQNLITVEVLEAPPIFYFGDHNLCLGETDTLSALSTGSWSSSDPGVLFVDNDGVVTAISVGSAEISFVDNITGCENTYGTPINVSPPPITNIPNGVQICAGSTFQALPTGVGSWSSTNPSIATIDDNGLITGLSTGYVSFVYTDANGCISAPSNSVQVLSTNAVTLPNEELCVGEFMFLSPSFNVTWESEDPAVATISDFGIVEAVSGGTTRFRVTNTVTGCQSDYSDLFTVNPNPDIAQTDSTLCIYSITQLVASGDGVWINNNPTIASIDEDGWVTPILAGTVNLTFQDTVTGCSQDAYPILVYEQPNINNPSSDTMCIGGDITLSSNVSGSWTSSDYTVASVNEFGVVEAISEGDVTITFTQAATSCVDSDSITLHVLPSIVPSFTGPTEICIGDTTYIQPSSGGTWQSSDNTTAQISDDGIIEGVSEGFVSFTYYADDGCVSTPSDLLKVNGAPVTQVLGDPEVCIGGTLNLLPSSGGVWISSDPSVATVDNNGLVTGVALGDVTFVYTDNLTGCSSEPTAIVSVVEGASISALADTAICVGSLTSITSNSTGFWSSSNTSIATIDESGTIYGRTAGQVVFTFTTNGSGCSSVSDTLTVNEKPVISFDGSLALCVGDQTTMSTTVAGTWVSSDTSKATIDVNGVITAKEQGVVRFTLISNDGCSSNQSGLLAISQGPTVYFVDGNPNICLGGQTQLYPSSGGVWTSSDPTIASVTASGLVEGIQPGNVSFVFNSSATGCNSDSLEGDVSVGPTLSVIGDTDICIDGYTQLQSDEAGLWISNNPSIADVDNNGVVIGRAPGSVTFTFISSVTGCTMSNNGLEINVRSCIRPDFNVAWAGLNISSDLNTNDDNIASINYASYTAVSTPIGSAYTLNLNNDGTYDFWADTPGTYRFKADACILPATLGCAKTTLQIEVVDNIFAVNNTVAHIDHAETYGETSGNLFGQLVTIDLVGNDDCINVNGCTIDNATYTLTSVPSSYTDNLLASGQLEIVPDAGNRGKGIIEYNVCNDAGDNCKSTIVELVVKDSSANNSVYASDDFSWSTQGNDQAGNVLINDGDAEGDNIAVIPVGSSATPVVVNGGSYYIQANGDFEFYPSADFTGNTEIVYTLCDDNTDQACQKATVHIVVFEDIIVNARVYLEGAIIENGGYVSSEGRPLMRDDLRVSPFDGTCYIPGQDPYTIGALPFSVLNYEHKGPGLDPQFVTIEDSTAVFGVSGQDAIVDWVFVELRSKDDNVDTLATRSGLLQRDGDIVDIDGVSPLRFPGVVADSFYVVVKHRNHLGIMSELVTSGDMVDFTSPSTPTFNFGTGYVTGYDYLGQGQNFWRLPGYLVLWGGDFYSDGKIKFTGPQSDAAVLLSEVLAQPANDEFNLNYDLAWGYFNGDFNMNGKAKFASPNDDTNLLYLQVLFYNLNTYYFTNYDLFIEQIPR